MQGPAGSYVYQGCSHLGAPRGGFSGSGQCPPVTLNHPAVQSGPRQVRMRGQHAPLTSQRAPPSQLSNPLSPSSRSIASGTYIHHAGVLAGTSRCFNFFHRPGHPVPRLFPILPRSFGISISPFHLSFPPPGPLLLLFILALPPPPFLPLSPSLHPLCPFPRYAPVTSGSFLRERFPPSTMPLVASRCARRSFGRAIEFSRPRNVPGLPAAGRPIASR